MFVVLIVFVFQAEDGIRDCLVTGVQTCALPISTASPSVAPAMYREEKSCTTGFGTAGSRRTRAESNSVTGAAILCARACPTEIGRASCRERVEKAEADVSVKKRKNETAVQN